MQNKVELQIMQKQKSTMAIALSLAYDKNLIHTLKTKNIQANSYKDLIEKFKELTLYQNVWVQLIDKDGHSIYRSWSPLKNDNITDTRSDLRQVLQTKQIMYSNSVGRFDLSIKSMIPIFDGKEFVGIIEVITHFNSIVKNLFPSDIGSVVVVTKEFHEQLKYPFTKIFLGEHYIANYNAPKELLSYLQEHGVQNYFNDSYKVENGYVISSAPIKDIFGNDIAYFIMFKKISDINSAHLEFFTFKWIFTFIVLLLLFLFIINNIILIKDRKQKKYYRNILDTASNIVIINNKKRMIDVNKTFFKYFSQYKTIDDFLKEYDCICDLFVNESGYLQSQMGSLYWLDYVVENAEVIHKAKVAYQYDVYYFAVTAARITANQEHFAIVLTDITKEEQYQKELLELSIKDTLTGIYNRHYFNKKVTEELNRTIRYKTPLSLIMFDIDFFKLVNDEHGHDVGDKVLIEYTKLIAQKLRSTDTFCRTGGEEFIIILPHTLLNEAVHIAEKLRKEVEEHKKILPLTMSFGVVEYQEHDTAQTLLKRVDQALYKAKGTGRNRVVVG